MNSTTAQTPGTVFAVIHTVTNRIVFLGSRTEAVENMGARTYVTGSTYRMSAVCGGMVGA